MKKLILLFISAFVVACSTSDNTEEPTLPPPENIFEGNIQLWTQQAVDDFGAEQYTIVTGYVWISTNDVVSLEPLSTLTKVDRVIIEYADNLLSLEGLNNLVQVRSFSITECQGLPNLNGLEGLTTVKPLDFSVIEWSGFKLYGNSNLQSISALRNITVAQGIWVRANNSLTSLDGLENIAEMPGDFLNNTSGGVIIGGDILVGGTNQGNTSLMDLCALQTLFSNGVFNPDWYIYANNGYNPNAQNIIDGNCSL